MLFKSFRFRRAIWRAEEVTSSSAVATTTGGKLIEPVSSRIVLSSLLEEGGEEEGESCSETIGGGMEVQKEKSFEEIGEGTNEI